MKKILFILALFVAGVAGKASTAAAATFVQIGNNAANQNTSWSINNYPRAATSDGTQNYIAGAGEVFSATSSAEISALTIYIGKEGTPAVDAKVEFCAYPTFTTTTQPCETGGSNVIASWTISPSSIVTNNGSNQDAWAQTLAFPTTMQLYSSVAYGVTVTYASTRSFSSSNIYRVGFSTSSSFNALGTAYLGYNGSCGGWSTAGSTSPSNCAPQQNGQHLRFYLTGASAPGVSLSVRQNGPDLSFYGNCVRSSDLPAGWTLTDNLVYLRLQDVTSATGTAVTVSTTCSASSTYDTLPQGPTRLWNGTFNATAIQSGTPGFQATASFTVTGSTVKNPIDALNLCITPDLFDLILHPSSIKSAVSCSFNSIVNTFADAPPFSWYTQIKTAVTATSTPATINGTMHWPNGQAFVLYDSSSSTAGVAGKINSFPLIGGKTIRQLEVIFLWCCFALYILILPWRFIKT